MLYNIYKIGEFVRLIIPFLSFGGIDDGARGIVEMLFCTSLIVLVGAADQPQSSPRKLQIVNTKASRFNKLLTATSRLMSRT